MAYAALTARAVIGWGYCEACVTEKIPTKQLNIDMAGGLNASRSKIRPDRQLPNISWLHNLCLHSRWWKPLTAICTVPGKSNYSHLQISIDVLWSYCHQIITMTPWPRSCLSLGSHAREPTYCKPTRPACEGPRNADSMHAALRKIEGVKEPAKRKASLELVASQNVIQEYLRCGTLKSREEW
jgi:hypothetical protein